MAAFGEYKQTTYQRFSVFTSQKDKNAPKDAPRYLRIQFRCVHFKDPDNIKSKATTGERPNQKYNANGCPAEVYIRFENNCYTIKRLVTTHNHVISEANFEFAPENRALTDEQQAKCWELLELDVQPRTAARALSKLTNKQVLPRDMQNIKSKFQKKEYPGNEMEQIRLVS